MQHPGLVAVLSRFWLGVAGGLGAGWLAFRGAMLNPASPAFQCVTFGALVAGLITLVRVGRPIYAVAIAVGFGLFNWGLAPESWVVASAGFVQGLGLFVVAIIFELLRRRGLQFGKFLVVGPLVGGVFLAAAPLVEFQNTTMIDTVSVYLRHAFVGVVIGDGVGLGIEIADLVALGLAPAGAPVAERRTSGVFAPTSDPD